MKGIVKGKTRSTPSSIKRILSGWAMGGGHPSNPWQIAPNGWYDKDGTFRKFGEAASSSSASSSSAPAKKKKPT